MIVKPIKPAVPISGREKQPREYFASAKRRKPASFPVLYCGHTVYCTARAVRSESAAITQTDFVSCTRTCVLLTRAGDIAKAGESTPSGEGERPAPVNFVITIDGEEHPIQLNNPIVLQMGNRERRIVLRSAP